jgi:hypothetical protein
MPVMGSSLMKTRLKAEKQKMNEKKKLRTIIRHGKKVPVGDTIKFDGSTWVSEGKGRFRELP